jgi:hypothetical protein
MPEPQRKPSVHGGSVLVETGRQADTVGKERPIAMIGATAD